MKLWSNNLAPNKGDDDVRAFVRKYTQVEIGAITRIEGDGTKPGVLIEVEGASRTLLMGMQRRLHRMYWDLHLLEVQILYFADLG